MMTRDFSQGEALSVLTHAPAGSVKHLAEVVLAQLEHITVLRNRTGLVMLPYLDSAQGTTFNLGEVLVSEAHLRIERGMGAGTEGYGMVLGRDAEFAVAVAVLDAALTAGVMSTAITTFLTEHAQIQQAADEMLLRKVESTRVEMETF